MGDAPDDIVTIASDDAVFRFTLNRPDKLNALNEEVRARLHESIRVLTDTPSIRVFVLQGAGRAFSAGIDLNERPGIPEPPDARRHALGAWQRVLDDLEAVPQVTVAALHGPVVGGAFLLASCCDLRVAASDTRFAIPELALGIPLTWGGIPRLVREIGLPRTRDVVMTGRWIGADEAHAWGFVQRLVPDGAEFAPAIDALIDELVAAPPGPLATTRAALRAIGRAALTSGWADPDLLSAALTRLNDPNTENTSHEGGTAWSDR